MSVRPAFATQDALRVAARAFVAAMGTGNAAELRDNLRMTVVRSDGLRALQFALTEDFNTTRQERIRQDNARRACPNCGPK